MILSEEHVLNLIEQNKYSVVRVYEGHLTDDQLKGKRPFEKVNGGSWEGSASRIKELSILFNGNFTLLFNVNDNATNLRAMSKCWVSFTKGGSKMGELESGTAAPVNNLDVATMKANIKRELLADIKAEQDQKRIEEMEAEMNELKTWSGKAAMMFNNVVQMWMNPSATAQAMQGTQQDINPNDLESALGALVEVLGEDVVIKLAGKLKSAQGASMIPMVKNFANS